MAETVQIMGLTKLRDNLQKIGRIAEHEAAIAMTRSGANLFKKAAQEKVPVKSGTLKKSISVKQISKGPHILYVVTTRKKLADKYRGRHAHLVEFGTRMHYEPRSSKRSGKKKKVMFIKESGEFFWNVIHPGAKPHPFMRPAFDENAGKAIDRMAKLYNRRLEKWQTLMGIEPEES